jgi:hypothetical protein
MSMTSLPFGADCRMPSELEHLFSINISPHTVPWMRSRVNFDQKNCLCRIQSAQSLAETKIYSNISTFVVALGIEHASSFGISVKL